MTRRRATDPDPRDAFEALYRSTRADLLRYLVRRTTDAEEAADLLAETYATAWRKLDSIRAGDTARLWLFGVARNLLLRSVRRRRVADALVDRLAGELRAAQPPAPSDGRAERLRSALAELSERDREILTLTAWEDLTPREIANVMATSPNAVRIRLHRARRQLDARLASPEEADAVWRSHAPVIDS
jgi:RNA polymerase sigma-70 factor (ECF subfamily)